MLTHILLSLTTLSLARLAWQNSSRSLDALTSMYVASQQMFAWVNQRNEYDMKDFGVGV